MAGSCQSPQRWPETTTITSRLQFPNRTLQPGTKVEVHKVLRNEVELVATGEFLFAVDRKGSNLLRDANARWASLTPEQKVLDWKSIQKDHSLWPPTITAASPSKSQSEKKREYGKPGVGVDVAGIKLGMTESEVRKKLKGEGWKIITDRKRVENIPGGDAIEYSETLHFKRERQDGAEYLYEVLGATFLPLPKGDARVRYVTFERMCHDKPTDGRNPRTDAKTVTSDFSTSTLALMKKKYGEPFRVNEGACTARGGGTTTSIPIYEVDYYPDVRVYQGTGGLQVKIADTCRQSFSIRIEDTDYAKHLRNEFSAFVKKRQDKASSSTNGEVDF